MTTLINNSKPLGRRNLVTSILFSIVFIVTLSLTHLLSNPLYGVLLLIIAGIASLEMTVLFYIKEGNIIIKESLLFPKSTKIAFTQLEKITVKNSFFRSRQDYRFELKDGTCINISGRLSKTERKQLRASLSEHGIDVTTDTTYI